MEKNSNTSNLVKSSPSTISSPDQIVVVTWKNLDLIKPEWLLDDGIFVQLKAIRFGFN